MPTKLLTPKNILIIFLVLYLVAGAFVAADYGFSIDHSQETDRAEVAMRRYQIPDPGDPVAEYLELGINQYYGTPLMSLFLLAENTFQPLLHTQQDAILHYMFFVSFLVGVVALFGLARRWMNDWAALAASLLFATQPLFFGHSFINPKDIPNISMFLLTVWAGFGLSDALGNMLPIGGESIFLPWQGLRGTWQSISTKAQFRLRRWAWVWLAVAAMWLTGLGKFPVRWLITWAYHAPEDHWLGALFRRFAGQAGSVSLEDYLHYGDFLAEQISFVLSVLTGLLLLLLVLQALRNPHKTLGRDTFLWMRGTDRAARRKLWGAVLLAGAVWGLAISTRVTSVTAGAMIGLYLLLRYREKAVLPLLGYVAVAIAMCIATWPYLWYFGFQGFLDGLLAFANYPYLGRVWFRGSIPMDEIPRTYLLQTMAIQFTEPLVVLAIIGMIVGMVLAVKKKIERVDLFILASWFILPILYAVIAQPTLYNNFRQFFFITPPLFLFAGIALHWLGEKIRRPVLLGVLLMAMLLPSAVDIVRLHPFEYLYYNQIVGGTQGAAGQYEMDYWNLSYQEMIAYINENAPENARILLRGPGDVIYYYHPRSDLQLSVFGLSMTEETLAQYDYLLMTTNHRYPPKNVDLDIYENAFEVHADGAVIAMVKKLHP